MARRRVPSPLIMEKGGTWRPGAPIFSMITSCWRRHDGSCNSGRIVRLTSAHAAYWHDVTGKSGSNRSVKAIVAEASAKSSPPRLRTVIPCA